MYLNNYCCAYYQHTQRQTTLGNKNIFIDFLNIPGFTVKKQNIPTHSRSNKGVQGRKDYHFKSKKKQQHLHSPSPLAPATELQRFVLQSKTHVRQKAPIQITTIYPVKALIVGNDQLPEVTTL